VVVHPLIGPEEDHAVEPTHAVDIHARKLACEEQTGREVVEIVGDPRARLVRGSSDRCGSFR
jgi:hypothetical protein